MNTSKKFIILSAPTGTGKTLLAAALQRLTNEQVVYTCTTRGLQDQVLSDFATLADGSRFAVTLKGRANYSTLLNRRATADLCTSAKEGHCRWCCNGQDGGAEKCEAKPRCPYEVAKARAVRASMPVLNTAMLLNLIAYGNVFREMSWLVMDEGDLVENALMSFVQLDITPRWARRLGITLPDKITVEESWVRWVQEQAIPAVQERLAGLASNYETVALREQVQLERLLNRMEHFLQAVEREKWVFLPEQLCFKPIFVSHYGEAYLWRHAEKVMLMSATVISSSQMCRDLGIPQSQAEVIDLPSAFAPERRSIYYTPVASVTNKTKSDAYLLLTEALTKLLASHPEVKVLVHTHSYTLADYVMRYTRADGRLVSYTTAQERDRVLEDFKASPEPLVLVAPSMERGIDMPDEACRVQVVLKVGWPDKGDRQVAARLYSDKKYGNLWYSVQAVRSLVQATGRATRHEKDWSVSFILDEEFARLYKELRYLFPKWWREALIMK